MAKDGIFECPPPVWHLQWLNLDNFAVFRVDMNLDILHRKCCQLAAPPPRPSIPGVLASTPVGLWDPPPALGGPEEKPCSQPLLLPHPLPLPPSAPQLQPKPLPQSVTRHFSDALPPPLPNPVRGAF